ncbi:MAG: ferrous iron transport protein B [Bacteroidales bacterium]|jgi:ferrous iron transport protein B|nr:ferrous iron transport protein B [Bacteroidales bacterium]
MLLTNLKPGQSAYIAKVKGSGSYRKRMMELGLVNGEQIKLLKLSSLGESGEYLLMGSHVMLRRIDAELIEVIPNQNYDYNTDNGNSHNFNEEVKNVSFDKNQTINVAIVGLSNSGKTTVFNALTGMNERVANYSGVTISAKEFELKIGDYNLKLADLPGTNSLCNVAESEALVKEFILKQTPDLILNVVDAGNLERNLYLTTELIDMDIPTVMALTMMDEFESSGKELDIDKLAQLLGLPVVSLDSKNNIGFDNLINVLVSVFNGENDYSRHIHVGYGRHIEESIKNLQVLMKGDKRALISNKLSARYLSIKLLEGDKVTTDDIANLDNGKEIIEETEKEKAKIEKEYGDTADVVITRMKYGFVKGALYEAVKGTLSLKSEGKRSFDRFLTHKYLGFPIFAFFIWLMFFVTFTLGAYPMEWIEDGVQWFNGFISEHMSDTMFKALMTEGVISGVGGVLVFLPNILLLFFFIALMEGTGYMSRAVFILDSFMHKIGLHGKSFIPLVMGFGCNVPAIMSTRILENRNERMISILINPFISCNARLPVYILFAGAFFPNHAAIVLFSIYFIGIFLAVFTAIWLRKFVFKAENAPFVMELPPYRIPTISSLFKFMWDKAKEYLKKIASVILISSVIFWALGYFPIKSKKLDSFDRETIEIVAGLEVEAAEYQLDMDSVLLSREQMRKALHHENSYLGNIGKIIEPAIRPLGFDWKLGISILSGIPAKEIIISSLAVLYQTDDAEGENSPLLREKIKDQKIMSGPDAGKPFFTPLLAFVFILFVSIYFPCIGSIIAIIKETGSVKWGMFVVFYTFGLAWVLSFAVYRIGLLIGL